MALYNFHRVLVAAAILFGFGMSLYGYRSYSVTGDTSNLTMAAVAGVLAIGMIAYLVYFNAKLILLRQLSPTSCEKCGYELRASIDAGKNSCPECGEAIPASMLPRPAAH